MFLAFTFAILILCLAPVPALACTTYYPLFISFFIPSALAGTITAPFKMTKIGFSVMLAGLAILLILKYLVYRREVKLEERPALKGFLFSNLVSTLLGFVIGIAVLIGTDMGLLLLFIIPLVMWVNRPLVRQLDLKTRFTTNISRNMAGFLIAMATIGLSIYSLSWMKETVMNSMPGNVFVYWSAKVVFYTIGTGLTLFLSMALETDALLRYHKAENFKEDRFDRAVFRANAAVFILFLLVAAAIMIPYRLNAPGFQVSFPSGILWNI